jgi:hypothetical protein
VGGGSSSSDAHERSKEVRLVKQEKPFEVERRLS